MLIFWQECKHILRSRFFWVVLVLGVVLSVNTVYTTSGYFKSVNVTDISISYAFTEKYGTSFTQKDAEKFVKYYMTETEEGKELVQNIQKDSGVKEISPEEIIDAYNNESSQIPAELEAVLQKMEEDGRDEEAEYSNILYYLDILQRPLELAENNSLNPESCNMKEKGENWLEESGKYFPKWKQELILDGYDRLEERVEEIRKNGENHHMLPIIMSSYGNREWFSFQFAGGSAMAVLWVFSFVLAGIAAARSLGGSLMNHIQGMVYTGKKGRKLIWRKILSVLAVSGSVYVLLYLMVTVFYVSLFRLDLYWNVPLASMVDYMDSVIPRFPITIGGYWWFQLGVGLGAVCIMALFFSAAMILTKNFYAGSAISIGVPLFLMMMIFMEPNAARNSLCMMSTPIGLYYNAGLFLQPQMFLFSILPHFEGVSLLVWGGFAAALAVLGFVRFRKTAL